LRETRLSETVENIAGERLKVASTQNEIKSAFEEAYSDLGYKAEIKFSTPEETPELKDKAGTAYVSSTGVHTMIININAKENSTKSGLIGTISEEGSHIINGVEGRQIETGTEEKGLESTGRATNSYFQDKYKDDKTTISMKSDGTIDTSKLGINVGDKLYLSVGTDQKLNNLRNKKREKIVKDFIDMLKENNLDITDLEDLLLKKNQDRNLFREMTSAEKLEFLNYYKRKSLDELGIELEEGTNAEKIIIKKKKDLDKLGLALDDPRRIFTEAIRDIIETKEIDNIIQITDNADIIKKIEDTQNINYNWKSWISAVNYREKDFSGNVIFYNLVQPDAKYGYYKLDGTFISENSKDAKIISQNASKIHELIAHPRDYAIQRKNNGQLNYIKLPQERFIETSINGKKVVYLENQYIHLNKLPKINNGWRIANDDLPLNLKKNKENNIKYFFKPAAYIVQPFYQDESTTLIFEKMVNDQDFWERPENRRFYYSESLKGYELRFETLEDLRNYFKKNGSERK